MNILVLLTTAWFRFTFPTQDNLSASCSAPQIVATSKPSFVALHLRGVAARDTILWGEAGSQGLWVLDLAAGQYTCQAVPFDSVGNAACDTTIARTVLGPAPVDTIPAGPLRPLEFKP